MKIYTHHLRSLRVEIRHKAKQPRPIWLKTGWLAFNICYFVGLALLTTLSFLAKSIFALCFHVGSALWKSISGAVKGFLRDLSRTKDLSGQRWKLLWQKSYFQTLATLILLAVVGSSVFLGVRFVALGLQLKDNIVSSTLLGKFYLDGAKNAIGSQDLDAAQNKFQLANQSFQNGQKQMDDLGYGLNQLLGFVPQTRDAQKLLAAASQISQSGDLSVQFYKDLKQIKFSTQGFSAPNGNFDAFNSLSAQLTQINQKLSSAAQNLSFIDQKNIPPDQQTQFLQLKDQAAALTQAFQNFDQIFSLAKNLVLGQKKILLLFENNNELRPAGGFIGTYGLVSLDDGKILDLRVSSIYDLDGQLKESIVPPLPLLNVNDRWYLRDANWFSDFPQSAKLVSSFYEKEGGQTPDVIIALTPNLISDLLKITGPINMPNYNVTLDADNFVEQTQVASGISPIEALNLPKQVLADFVPTLMQKLQNIDASAWPTVLQDLQQNLLTKQIALYSRDSDLQNQFDQFHWTGSVGNADRDYLQISGANLGGTKTDLYIDQKLSLYVNISESGEVIDTLKLTKTNRLPKMDKTNNLSFVRVLVPSGSQLISNLGFDYKTLEPPAEIKNFKINSDARKWENDQVRDVVSGTYVGKESGKTFFGNWLNVDGGESKTVSVVYKLPFKISSVDRYSLLLQKQLGALPYPIDLTINFSGRRLEWKNFDTQDLQVSSLKSAVDVNKDYFLGAVFSKLK